MAQFMVQNKLTAEDVIEKIDELSLPSSVIEMMSGAIGYPPGGFPEPLRSQVNSSDVLFLFWNIVSLTLSYLCVVKIVKDRPIFEGRPGADIPPMDLEQLKAKLVEEHGNVTEEDVLSAALYPSVRLLLWRPIYSLNINQTVFITFAK